MINEKDKEFLDSYDASVYDKPSVTVDVVLLRLKETKNSNYRKLSDKKLQVFLMKRTSSPCLDMWAIPGTFVPLDKTCIEVVEDCVKRKIGVSDYYVEQLYTFDDVKRDPRTRILSVSYLALTKENESYDASKGEWFDISFDEGEKNIVLTKMGNKTSQDIKLTLSSGKVKLDNILRRESSKNKLKETVRLEEIKNDLAFDHIKIIYNALIRIRNKIEYTDIAFNLLDSKFTLTGLKQLYELILGQKLLDANFRRKISKMVVKTDDSVTGLGHRSSAMYMLNSNWDKGIDN